MHTILLNRHLTFDNKLNLCVSFFIYKMGITTDSLTGHWRELNEIMYERTYMSSIPFIGIYKWYMSFIGFIMNYRLQFWI